MTAHGLLPALVSSADDSSPALSATQLLAAGFAVFFLVSCANPQPPSGGPRDTAPPLIIDVLPEPGEVNVDRESMTMEFDKFIDRSSFEQAISITPDFDVPPDIRWSGRSVDITFPDTLRDNTTYIVTLDTDLRDERGNTLNEPVTIAFSTGPEINQGAISGEVVNAADGSPRDGIDVFAYAHPDSLPPAELDSLPEAPDYRTQTGSEGTFSFEYLEEQPYYVVAVQDDNRNREPDPLEPYAVPPEPLLVADRDGTMPDAPWVVTRQDTLAPELIRVNSRTERRHELRFDEPVTIADRAPELWAVRDSADGARAHVDAVYHLPDDRSVLMLRTEPLDATAHEVSIPAATVADTTGTPLPPTTSHFTPSTDPDTLQTRFRAFFPDDTEPDEEDVHTLLPGEAPAVRINQPFDGHTGLPDRDSTHLHDVITVRDSVGEARSVSIDSEDGVTYQLQFTPPLDSEEEATVEISGAALQRPDTTFTRTYRRISDRELGALGGTALWPGDDIPDDALADPLPEAEVSGDSTANRPPVRVEAHATGSGRALEPRHVYATPDGRFLIDDLPERPFRFRAFADYDGTGQWDGGQLVPYRPAEPITWGEETPEVRPRWETMLETPLRLPDIER